MGKISEVHAASRLVQRYTGLISWEEFKRRVMALDYVAVVQQTTSRWLCRMQVTTPERAAGVWFVMNRSTKSVITVLTEKKAAGWLTREQQREWRI